MRIPADLRTGREILAAVLPFLAEIAASQLSATTLRRHFGNVFLLGGELIDRVNFDGHLRSLPGITLLLHFLDEEGGPLCRHLAFEGEHREYDSTCRKLYRSLTLAAGKGARFRRS